MSKRHETRAAKVTGTDGRTFEARAVAYDVVDDYGTRFLPGVFAKSLAERMPVVAWAHSWDEPIGRIMAAEERDDGLYVTGQLSDPDAVPRARQAIAQLADGTITDVSVGFWRTADRKGEDGIIDITEGDLDEVSLVLRGAVPGAKILAVRSGSLDLDAVVELARKKAAGEITDAEAKAAVDLLAHADAEPAAAVVPSAVPTVPPTEPTDAEVDAALALIDRSRR